MLAAELGEPPAADDSMAALEALMASSDDGDGDGDDVEGEPEPLTLQGACSLRCPLHHSAELPSQAQEPDFPTVCASCLEGRVMLL
jgi:hypothetical protein